MGRFRHWRQGWRHHFPRRISLRHHPGRSGAHHRHRAGDEDMTVDQIILDKTPAGYKFTQAHTYVVGGKRHGVVARYNAIDSNKRPKCCLPFPDEDGVLVGPKGFTTPRPLYNHDHLTSRPDAPVLVVEGERTADATAKLFPDYVIVTSQGGANAAGNTDWRPLSGRRVTIWPDNDPAGRKYAHDVRKHVPWARLVMVPSDGTFEVGWDLADTPPTGIDLRNMLESAPTPVHFHAPDASTCQARRPGAIRF